ncbi:MAG TPA: hypothetical protein VIM75_22160 [Ohtaekwangia sp.]|uniref:hypothetical protein n=1 Tax=Ohtaekwangia sp. TaxID=2066019 RepID=UPI002F93B3A9
MMLSLPARIVYIAIACFAVWDVGAQNSSEPPKIIPPTPNAAAFAKYGNIPISTYTGVPEISIPLYEIKVRDISVPISLSYHASGIKVADESSRVGLGWVLNAGGVISRNIINRDDFEEDVTGYLSPNNIAPVLPLFHTADGVTQCAQGGTNLTMMSGEQYDLTKFILGSSCDFEPDQFTYNFLGESGNFVLTRDKKPILQRNEKIRIRSTTLNNKPTWEVTTANGTVYKFEAFDYFEPSDNMPGNRQQITSWYLTSIISVQGEQVTFTYQTHSAFTRPVGSQYEFNESTIISCPGDNAYIPRPLYPPPYIPKQIPARNYTSVSLSRIDWKNGFVKFNYADDRKDIQGDVRLSSIQVFSLNGTVPLQEFVFDQDYFVSPTYGSEFTVDVPVNFTLKRLKLRSLMQKSGTDPNLQPLKHSFEYYEDEYLTLPPKNSYARDHWGYYNGRHSNTSLIPSFQRVTDVNTDASKQQMYQDAIGIMGPERSPSSYHASAFSLKQITYPTKSRTTFYYESNDYNVDELDPLSQPESYSIQTPVMYDGRNKGQVQSVILDLTNEYVNKAGKTIPIEFSGVFRAKGPCKNIVGIAGIYFELYHENGTSPISHVDLSMQNCQSQNDQVCIYCDNSNQSMSPVFSYKNTYILPPGKYRWVAYIPGGDTQFEDIVGNYTWWADARKQPQDNALNMYAIAGGIRISKIEDYDPESTGKANVRTYDYHYTTDVDNDGVKEIHSYGRKMTDPSYGYIEADWQKLVSRLTKEVIMCTKVYHVIYAADSNIPLTNSQGNFVGYDKVTERLGENGELGYTEYQFENHSDDVKHYWYPYSDYVNTVPLRPPSHPTTSYDRNGMMTLKRQFDASGKLVHSIENTYDSKYAVVQFGMEYRSIQTDQDAPTDEFQWGHPGSATIMLVYPAMKSTFPYLKSSVEVNYKDEMEVSKTTEYFYDKEEHLQLTKMAVNESNGHKTITTIKYPADYTDAQAGSTVMAMKGEKFMHANAIETTVLDEAPDGTRKIKKRDLSLFSTFGNLVLPTEQAFLKADKSLPVSSVPAYQPASAYDPQFYKRSFAIAYDANGNIQTLQKRSNYNTVMLWGYNQTFPIAEIKNANTADVFHTSFEEDGVAFTDAGNASQAFTGTKVLNASSYTFPSSYAPAAGSFMSYWYWANNKWNFSGIIPFQRTITISGDRLDEVRAFPKGAFMTTYTFDPMYGVTSRTDENNIVTYYRYDAFGRLSVVKDQNGKILKQYIYHYKD